MRPAPTGSPDDVCSTLPGSVPCHNLAWPNGNRPAVPDLRTGRRWSEAWCCSSSRHLLRILRRAFGSLPGFCLLNPWDSQVLNLRKPVGGWAWRIHARPPVIVNHIVRRDGRSPRSDSVPYLVGQSVGPTRHQQSPGRRPFVASNSGHPTSPVCFSVLNGSVALHRSLGKSRDDDIRKPDPRNARSNGGRHLQAMASFAAHRVDCPPANVERADAPILRVAPALTLMLIVVRQPSTELPKSPGQTKTFTQQELGVNVGWRP